MNTPYAEFDLIPGKLYCWNSDEDEWVILLAHSDGDQMVGLVEDRAVVMFLEMVDFKDKPNVWTELNLIHHRVKIIVDDMVGWVNCYCRPDIEKQHGLTRHFYFSKFSSQDESDQGINGSGDEHTVLLP